MLSNRFGHRLVVMAGGVLISTGMVIASFARSVVDMYVTIGLISGEFPSCTCSALHLLQASLWPGQLFPPCDTGSA